MHNIINFFKSDKIKNSRLDYYFLENLEEKEYPKYLAKMFNYRTGEKLPLEWSFKSGEWRINKKRCKTFNQKIQWIKLYGITDLMRDCSDKVKVRDYVREKIGSEYLKPVLQIIPSCHSENLENQNNNLVDFQVVQNLKEERSKKVNKCCHTELVSLSDVQEEKMLKHACINDETENKNINYTAVQHDRPISALQPNLINKTDVSTYFDKIDFCKLPNSFVMKCSLGCKWHYIIKDKEKYLKNKRLLDITKVKMTGWLQQEYCYWNGFEMQYAKSSKTGENQFKEKEVKAQIIIEPLLREDINVNSEEIQVYCFNGIPKLIARIYNERKIALYDEKLNIADDIFNFKNYKADIIADDIIKQAHSLSLKLAEKTVFVRVDWMLYKNKIYFAEMTFTPYSGFYNFKKSSNLKLGSWLNLN